MRSMQKFGRSIFHLSELNSLSYINLGSDLNDKGKNKDTEQEYNYRHYILQSVNWKLLMFCDFYRKIVIVGSKHCVPTLFPCTKMLLINETYLVIHSLFKAILQMHLIFAKALHCSLCCTYCLVPLIWNPSSFADLFTVE